MGFLCGSLSSWDFSMNTYNFNLKLLLFLINEFLGHIAHNLKKIYTCMNIQESLPNASFLSQFSFSTHPIRGFNHFFEFLRNSFPDPTQPHDLTLLRIKYKFPQNCKKKGFFIRRRRKRNLLDKASRISPSSRAIDKQRDLEWIRTASHNPSRCSRSCLG